MPGSGALPDARTIFRIQTEHKDRFLVPIAQNIERTRPKRQVAGESPAGDTNFQCGCGSTAECGRAKAETTVRLRSPAPAFARHSEASEGCPPKHAVRRWATITACELRLAGHLLRGHSSASQSGRVTCVRSKVQLHFAKRTSLFGQLTCKAWEAHTSVLTIFCPCGVAQPTRLPLIAGDHRSEAGQGHQLRIALKALSVMRPLGKRLSSVHCDSRSERLSVGN